MIVFLNWRNCGVYAIFTLHVSINAHLSVGAMLQVHSNQTVGSLRTRIAKRMKLFAENLQLVVNERMVRELFGPCTTCSIFVSQLTEHDANRESLLFAQRTRGKKNMYM